ncbi:hypothetical protein [Spirosoma koreense]
MKKMLNGWTWPNLLALAFVIGMILYITIRDLYNRHVISKCYKVAVARLIDTQYKKTGKFGTIQFHYKNRVITSFYQPIYDPSGYHIGKKYFVNVSCQSDSIFKVDWKTPVADSLAMNPPEGWPSELIYSQ